jgi:hypothetical protein
VLLVSKCWLPPKIQAYIVYLIHYFHILVYPAQQGYERAIQNISVC